MQNGSLEKYNPPMQQNRITFLITTSRTIILSEIIKGACSNTEVGVRILVGLSLVTLAGAEATAVRSAHLLNSSFIQHD